MSKFKIAFSDFWDGFLPENNFFNDLFSDTFSGIEIVNFFHQPDVLIYSCFGHQHRYTDRSKTKKIFYTGENLRPNYNDCDLSLTFDFDNYNGRNFRLPLWMLQIDWFNKKGYGNPEYVLPYEKIISNEYIDTPKTKFCCAVFNSDSPHRFDTVRKLSEYKKVDCWGKPHGNWFYGESGKYKILSEYKFNICYENSIFPGYYTEKLFHAKTSGTVPLYWADPNIEKDFNKNAFINLYDYGSSVDSLIEYIKYVDNNEEIFQKYRNEKLFNTMPTLTGLKQFLKEKLL